MMDPYRQTGRTTTAIEQCRERAAKGEKVAYLVAYENLREYCVALFDWTGWERRDRFHFLHPSGGAVVFMARANAVEKLRGRRFVVIQDHFWPRDPSPHPKAPGDGE